MTETSWTTQKALGEALKDALRATSLKRITVRQLTDAAGLTRQTFYYHFSDVYDLATWVFKEEIADRILSHASYEQWSDGFLSLLVWMSRHPEQVRAVIDSLKHEELELFLHHQLRHMMESIVDELDTDIDISTEDRNFVVDHFTLSVLGHLLHWIARGMRDDPYILVENLELILRGGVKRSLELFARRHQTS